MDKRTYTRLTRITPFDGANGGALVIRFHLISSTSMKSRGPDFSEGDWQGMGLPVGRQIRAVYAQHEAGMMSKEDEVRRQLDQAERIYRELSFVGEDRGFNPDVVKVYSDLADVCAEWESSPELNLGTDPEEHPDRFNELHGRCKELTS